MEPDDSPVEQPPTAPTRGPAPDERHALYLRMAAFQQHSRSLYNCCLTQPLEWPSHTVEWLPDRKRIEGLADFALHHIAVGTQALPDSLNYVHIVEMAIPDDVEGVPENDDDDMDEIYGKRFADVRGHARLAQLLPVRKAVHTIRASPHRSNYIAVQQSLPEVGIYSLDTRPPFSADPDDAKPDIVLVQGHKQPGWALEWSHMQPGLIATGADDDDVCMWDLRNTLQDIDSATQAASNNAAVQARVNPGAHSPPVPRGAVVSVPPVRVLKRHKDTVNDVAWHRSQEHILVSGSADTHAHVWDTRASNNVITFEEAHEGGVTSVDCHPNAAFQIATAGVDGAVRIWDIRRPGRYPVQQLLYHNDAVTRVRWAPFDDGALLSSGADGLVVTWNLERTELNLTDGTDELCPEELAFLHAGHCAKVTDAAWAQNMGDEWLIASVDAANFLQVHRPRRQVVTDHLQVDDFDLDNQDSD